MKKESRKAKHKRKRKLIKATGRLDASGALVNELWQKEIEAVENGTAEEIALARTALREARAKHKSIVEKVAEMTRLSG